MSNGSYLSRTTIDVPAALTFCNAKVSYTVVYKLYQLTLKESGLYRKQCPG